MGMASIGAATARGIMLHSEQGILERLSADASIDDVLFIQEI
jgi:hypothetical protein